MTSTLKRSAHAVSLATGRVTAAGRMLPGFMIIGAQRCGTTSLYRALAHHPLVLKPVLRKGVHFFDVAYDHDLAWYRAHFPLRATAERLRQRYGHQPIAFESSPYYMFHPLAATRIAGDLPGIKMIVLVRDPVERALSAHAHEVARGFEPEASFERAVELEEGRLAGEAERLCAEPYAVSRAHRHHAYLARGRYADQLTRLDLLVGHNHLLVLDSHRFFTDPGPVYDRVLAFLGLPHLGTPAFERHNARPRSTPLPAALRRRLATHFHPSDARLRNWLGDDPSWLC